MLFRIGYAFFFSAFWCFSKLPYWVLYRISDGLFVFVFHILKYRRTVAEEQLRQAFPEKSEQELAVLLKKSYQHFSDMIVEMVKLLTIPDDEMKKRMVLTNPEFLEEICRRAKQSGIGVLSLSSHCGNFEWMFRGMVIHSTIHVYGVYAPLTNKFFEFLFLRTRSRPTGTLIPMRNAIETSAQRLRDPGIMGFMCDQAPARSSKWPLYFTKFFGLQTAVHNRFSELAIQSDADVHFIEIHKVKRGFYEFTLHPLPIEKFRPYSKENSYRFTSFHTEFLEKLIRKQPECWFWTHRRWKHTPRAGDVISPEAEGLGNA